MAELLKLEPAFQENIVAIVMGTSDEYVPYLYVSLTSVLAHISIDHNYDIVILTSGVSENSKSMLAQLNSKRANVSIRFINVDPIIQSYHFFVRDWFHPIIYARLIIPDLMSKYKRVLYLDSDTIALTDLAELYGVDLCGKILGGVRDTAHVACYHIPNSDVRIDLDCRLKLKYPDEYINTGVLLFDIQAFGKEYTSEYLLNYSSSQEWKWQDQDIFMTLCEGKIQLLPDEWNVLIHGPIRADTDLMERTAPSKMFQAYLNARSAPKIIHYVANSFLLLNPLPDQFPFFWKYARQTPYYEEILFRSFQKNYMRTDIQALWDNLNQVKTELENPIRSIKKKTSVGKHIKALIKKLFPANTKRGYYLRFALQKAGVLH